MCTNIYKYLIRSKRDGNDHIFREIEFFISGIQFLKKSEILFNSNIHGRLERLETDHITRNIYINISPVFFNRVKCCQIYESILTIFFNTSREKKVMYAFL